MSTHPKRLIWFCETERVAEDLEFPNGTVITPDGKTLIVGESWGARLTAFDLQPDGSLSNRRRRVARCIR